ncbi:MAG: biopolymer transporter ExbD [Candidatus Contendobacter sp.]|nr:biopolymer transporter ExbD [Candidatus Contendobacter sp.]
MNLRPRRREQPEINLVPMIDVVLVLLIFFMIATSLRPESELGLRLPEASGQPMPTDQTELNVEVDANGRYTVNGKALETADAAGLKAALQAFANGRNAPLILRADGRTPHQAVVTVLEVAGQLGLKQLAIATTDPSTVVPSTLQPALSPDP